MDKQPGKTHKKLAEIFGKMNLCELPAMSTQVGEVLALTRNRRVRADELAEVILKDYSLTNKVLQVVNSAFYSRGVPITTIERAVTALGIEVIQELTVAISLIEEFIQSGIEKAEISKLLTQSLLSANLSKLLVIRKKIPVSPEEAYICGMLHDLGRIVILIYLPDVFRRIEIAKRNGGSEEAMMRLMLKQLTFAEIGMEVARFWNFSETIILAMEPHPPASDEQADTMASLQHLAVFSNSFIKALCNGQDQDLAELLAFYGEKYSLACHELLEMVHELAEAAGSVSEIIRFGLTRLKVRSKTLIALKRCKARSAA